MEFKIKQHGYLFAIRTPKEGESFLWYVDADGFRYSHFFQCGIVENSGGLTAVQLVIGPVMFSLAWLSAKPPHPA